MEVNIWFIFFAIFYAAIWVGSLWCTAHFSGWSELAQKYTCVNPYQRAKKGWQWAKLNWVNYKNCLWLGMDTDGIYLESGPTPLFKLFHPNLLIPWSAIKSVEARQYWFMRLAEIKFNDSDVKLAVTAKWQPDLQRFVGDKIKSDKNKINELIQDG